MDELPDKMLTLYDGKAMSSNSLLRIDEDNLSVEYSNQAALLGYIGILTAEAEADAEELKLEMEAVYAEKDSEARIKFNASRTKFTEAMVQAYINLDTDYNIIKGKRIEAYRDYKIMRALENAMKERGSMLVSLGAMRRQELDMTNLSMRLGQ